MIKKMLCHQKIYINFDLAIDRAISKKIRGKESKSQTKYRYRAFTLSQTVTEHIAQFITIQNPDSKSVTVIQSLTQAMLAVTGIINTNWMWFYFEKVTMLQYGKELPKINILQLFNVFFCAFSLFNQVQHHLLTTFGCIFFFTEIKLFILESISFQTVHF